LGGLQPSSEDRVLDFLAPFQHSQTKAQGRQAKEVNDMNDREPTNDCRPRQYHANRLMMARPEITTLTGNGIESAMLNHLIYVTSNDPGLQHYLEEEATGRNYTCRFIIAYQHWSALLHHIVTSPRTLKKHLEHLESLGLIGIYRAVHQRGAPESAHSYRLCLKRLCQSLHNASMEYKRWLATAATEEDKRHEIDYSLRLTVGHGQKVSWEDLCQRLGIGKGEAVVAKARPATDADTDQSIRAEAERVVNAVIDRLPECPGDTPMDAEVTGVLKRIPVDIARLAIEHKADPARLRAACDVVCAAFAGMKTLTPTDIVSAWDKQRAAMAAEMQQEEKYHV
jgi:hypothetical protein